MSTYKEIDKAVTFLREYLIKSKCNGFILGLSGGVDSAVVAALANKAIKSIEPTMYDMFHYMPEEIAEPKILKLISMPISSSSSDATAAAEVATSLGVSLQTLDLSDVFALFDVTLNGNVTNTDAKVLGNLKARMRMSALYHYAGLHNLLVLGTDNRTETYTGYFTKHGDGAADIFPISHLVKREVYEMAKALELPDIVITRPASAGLWEGQTDESEMGIPYDYIDNVLEGMSEVNNRRYSVDENVEFRQKLARLHNNSEHKRITAPNLTE